MARRHGRPVRCRPVDLPDDVRPLFAACAFGTDRRAPGQRAQPVFVDERPDGDHHLVPGIRAGERLWLRVGAVVRRARGGDLPRGAEADPERLRLHGLRRRLRQSRCARAGRAFGVVAGAGRDSSRARKPWRGFSRFACDDAAGVAELDCSLLGRPDPCAACDHGRRQSRLAAAHRDHVPVRELRRLVAACEHVLPRARDEPAEESLMAHRASSLLERALNVFVAFALVLAVFLWAGKALLPRSVDEIYLDSQRLGALRTFERAIVPMDPVRDHPAPQADWIRGKLEFCTDPLKDRKTLSARAKRADACASVNAAEELACHLTTINSRLAEMSVDATVNRERALSARHVVNVERWIEAIRDPQQPVACRSAAAAAKQLAAGDARLLRLLAWRDLTPKSVVATQFAPEQAVKVAGRILEQRNPWGGVPGCTYYAGPNGKLLFVTDRNQTNRQACLAMRPAGTNEKDLEGVRTPPESLDVILADLDNIRLPWRDLFRAYTEKPAGGNGPIGSVNAESKRIAVAHGPNRLLRAKHEVDVGFNIHLTIDASAQRIVQEASSCYSGDWASCERAGIAGDKKFNDFTGLMYERAAVRMAAVALIDVPTGRIEALGSAHTDCYQQEYDGPGRNAD